MKVKTHPWAWLPTLYLAQGLPYVIVMTVSGIMYKRMGIPNEDITLYTGWLNLPWVIKPLWSPIVDILKTKRWWIVVMQLLIGAGLASVALAIPGPSFFRLTMAVFFLLAFSSATHDIAIDGFYMLALTPFQQSYFVGIRSTFYRIAMISGQGLLVMLAGWLEKSTGDIPRAWLLIFITVAVVFVALAIYHYLVLPQPETGRGTEKRSFQDILKEFFGTFASFFEKKGIVVALAFILLYRLGEAQLVKIASLFMLDKRVDGGLELATETVGFIYGTLGIIALVAGGILGGIAISLKGLKYWLLPMMVAINLPDLTYVYLAYVQPENIWLINASVIIEQFGYGFGFTAFMMFMIHTAEGEYKTAFYAICTAFMALGMMLPGMAAGWLQKVMGYEYFFIWVMICTIPSFFLVRFLHIDPQFGMKTK
ncbi:MAG: MFS transporter [Bacteroidales bacterium]|nr:MFS transporter [Bacteroidales bacterium]